MYVCNRQNEKQNCIYEKTHKNNDSLARKKSKYK